MKNLEKWDYYPCFDNIKSIDFEYNNNTYYRYSAISLGTIILYKKFNGLFSNMLTFVYFYVKFLKKYPSYDYKNYEINRPCILYLLKYMPLRGIINDDFILWFNPKRIINNTICSHLVTGDTSFPHFFISSSQNKEVNKKIC